MKTKFLLLLLLVGLVNFSCSDDNDDPVVILKADKLSINEGKVGDEVVLTGEGFSENKEENIVSFNEVQATILQASASELKVTVPEGATTGKLTVKVAEKSIDFGVFTVRRETLFMIKSDYSGEVDKETLITMDPTTGEEQIYCELPAFGANWLYSSITYLAKTNELAILAISEESGKDVGLCMVNLETKVCSKVELEGEDRYYYYDLFSDKEDNLYATKCPDMSQDHVYMMKIDPSTGTQKVFQEYSDSYSFGLPIYFEEANEVVVMIADDYDYSVSRLGKINMENGTKSDINLKETGNYQGLTADKDNNLYFIKKDRGQDEAVGIKLNLETGKEETFIKFQETNHYLGKPIYFQTTNELLYLPEDNGDSTLYLLKVNLDNKSILKIELNPGENIYYGNMIPLYM
ncbi:MAG: IPT/TIG domain-containing protein [Marinifilaceae bacterium]